MKITAVEALPVNRFLFVKVHTDEGIIGIGESGAWGHLEASRAAINKFAVSKLIRLEPLSVGVLQSQRSGFPCCQILVRPFPQQQGSLRRRP